MGLSFRTKLLASYVALVVAVVAIAFAALNETLVCYFTGSSTIDS